MPGSIIFSEFSKTVLDVIDLKALQEKDSQESARLLAAVKEKGFFYLDLRHIHDSQHVLGLAEKVYKLEEDLFNLSDDEKMKCDVDNMGYMKLNGYEIHLMMHQNLKEYNNSLILIRYKPIGRNFGGVGGRRDGFESWAIPKDGVLCLGNDSFLRPRIFDENMSMLRDFMLQMQSATGTIHATLSRMLDLPMGNRFEDYHRPDQPSPCLLRLLKYHAQPFQERGPPQTPHTDLGSLTILFTEQPGLQVLPEGAKDWVFVAPKPGHAIVNIGDAMSMMTNGLFQSCLHRVSPLPDQSMQTRYSFAYLQRAEEHTRLSGVNSPLLPPKKEGAEVVASGEWLRAKFSTLRAKTHTEDKNWVLTGRVDTLPA